MLLCFAGLRAQGLGCKALDATLSMSVHLLRLNVLLCVMFVNVAIKQRQNRFRINVICYQILTCVKYYYSTNFRFHYPDACNCFCGSLPLRSWLFETIQHWGTSTDLSFSENLFQFSFLSIIFFNFPETQIQIPETHIEISWNSDPNFWNSDPNFLKLSSKFLKLRFECSWNSDPNSWNSDLNFLKLGSKLPETQIQIPETQIWIFLKLKSKFCEVQIPNSCNSDPNFLKLRSKFLKLRSEFSWNSDLIFCFGRQECSILGSAKNVGFLHAMKAMKTLTKTVIKTKPAMAMKTVVMTPKIAVTRKTVAKKLEKLTGTHVVCVPTTSGGHLTVSRVLEEWDASAICELVREIAPFAVYRTTVGPKAQFVSLADMPECFQELYTNDRHPHVSGGVRFQETELHPKEAYTREIASARPPWPWRPSSWSPRPPETAHFRLYINLESWAINPKPRTLTPKPCTLNHARWDWRASSLRPPKIKHPCS